MAFSKKKVEERKAWLSSFVPGTFLDHSATHITYTDFINKVGWVSWFKVLCALYVKLAIHTANSDAQKAENVDL